MHISKLHQGMWAVPLGLDCRPMGGGATAWQGLHLLENLIVRRLPSGPSQYNLLTKTHRGSLLQDVCTMNYGLVLVPIMLTPSYKTLWIIQEGFCKNSIGKESAAPKKKKRHSS